MSAPVVEPTPVQPVPSATSRRRRETPGSFERVVRYGWAAAVLVLIGYPLLRVFGESVVVDGAPSLQNYGLLTSEPNLVTATVNSLWIATGSTLGSLVLAIPLAWLVVRTDMPLRRFFRSTAILTFAAPSFIAAMGWILLLGPQNGLLNQGLMAAFGLASPPFDIFTPWGIIFVLTTFLYPMVFTPVCAALEGIDPNLEQAAGVLGASRLRVLRTVTFPLVMPAVLAGSLLVFVTSTVIFGPVALLGAPTGFQTIPTVLFQLMNVPPRIDLAAVVAVPVLAIVAVLLVVQKLLLGKRRYQVIGGKPGRQAPVRLGRMRPVALGFGLVVVFLSLVLPFGILLVTSFRRSIGRPLGMDNLTLTANYAKVFAQDLVGNALSNSLLLAIGGTVLALTVSVAASWLIHRTRSRTNALIPAVMAAPLAFPGAILGIGMIIAYAGEPVALGGTLIILLVAYTAHALPFTFGYVNAGMSQVAPEAEEASRSLGASWGRTWRKITVPLLRPSLLAAALLNFVLLFRELEMSIFLYTGANPTVSTVLYGFAGQSMYQLASALAVVVLVVNIGVTTVAIRLLDRSDVRTR